MAVADAWWLWLLILVALLAVSAFFSGSETALMSLNPYRLRHRARKKGKRQARAKQLSVLLKRPDRVLGAVLLGNTFANIAASAVATLVASHFGGERGVLFATLLLTLVILVLAETLPKTVAALYPEAIAYPVSPFLSVLLRLLQPVLWVVNGVVNAFLRVCGLRVEDVKAVPLSSEELETVVHEASSSLSQVHQRMMVSILACEGVRVEEVMVPRQEVKGIDASQPWPAILEQLQAAKHTYLPVFDQHLDQVHGVINTHRLLPLALSGSLDEGHFQAACDPVYFVPESTLISKQLLHFQKKRRYVAVVVDEYGEVMGLVHIKDILEEVVGAYDDAPDAASDRPSPLLVAHEDGSFTVDGSVPLRDLKRLAGMDLPSGEANTLSGLVIEQLQMIPSDLVCLHLGAYRVEVLMLSENRIERVKLSPAPSDEGPAEC